MFALTSTALPGAVAQRQRQQRRSRTAPVCSASPATPAAAPKWNSKWPTGIPPEMGGHKMPSGQIAPLSKSSGCGTGLPHFFQYHEKETDVKVEVHQTEAAANAALVNAFVSAANSAVTSKGAFTVALSGGSMPASLAGLKDAKIDWSKVHVFLVDERCVPADDPANNLSQLKAAFLGSVPIPANQVHGIEGNLPAVTEAMSYEHKIKSSPAISFNNAGLPVFDLILLGIGPDAHFASHFPNRLTLAEKTRLVVPVEDAPVSAAKRVTLSLPVVNAAARVIFSAVGGKVASAVQRTLEFQSLPGAVPAQLVRPEAGVTWQLDKEAAKYLRPQLWNTPAAFPRSEVPAPAK